MDPVNQKVRELVQAQIGSQVLALCEAHARIEAQAEEIAALKEQIERLKAGADV